MFLVEILMSQGFDSQFQDNLPINRKPGISKLSGPPIIHGCVYRGSFVKLFKFSVEFQHRYLHVVVRCVYVNFTSPHVTRAEQ